MADERKAGALILSNLGMFNESVVLFENVVQPTILKSIDYMIETFAKENSFDGVFDLAGDDTTCWLAAPGWKNEDYDYKAHFKIEVINGDKDYWVALFCKQGSEGGEVGFMFDIKNTKQFGGRIKWNAYIKNINQDTVFELENHGFKYQGKGKFFLPIYLNANEIKAAWEEYGDENPKDFAEYCLSPLLAALQAILKNRHMFDEIMGGCNATS